MNGMKMFDIVNDAANIEEAIASHNTYLKSVLEKLPYEEIIVLQVKLNYAVDMGKAILDKSPENESAAFSYYATVLSLTKFEEIAFPILQQKYRQQKEQS